MANQENLWENLAAYLSGNCSEQERLIVEGWINESAENKQLFRELQMVWQNTGLRLPYPDIQSNELLNELRNSINANKKPSSKLVSFVSSYTLYLRVAATVCLLLVSYFVIRWASTDKSIIIETRDEVATIYLPDSTKVWLNTNSRIEYAQEFILRNVELQGEAFFSVRKDSTGFTVQTRHISTAVVGTAFNIKEQADTTVTVTVAEGTVRCYEKDTVKGQAIVVEAGNKVVYTPAAGLKKTAKADPLFAAWRELNNPVFSNEKANPGDFLRNTYSWRKNTINQTVIEGTIKNNASLAAYHEIVLQVTYRKLNGDSASTNIRIAEMVLPGKAITYRKRLLDILTDKQNISAKVRSADATSKGVY